MQEDAYGIPSKLVNVYIRIISTSFSLCLDQANRVNSNDEDPFNNLDLRHRSHVVIAGLKIFVFYILLISLITCISSLVDSNYGDRRGKIQGGKH